MLGALGERDETAEICRDRDGKPEPDADLRDTETVPLKESIEEYFKREVLPHVPDAWIDESKTKVGYEIPLNRHFYRYEPPRPLEVIEADIKTLEGEILDVAQGGDGVKYPAYPTIQAQRRRVARRRAGALGGRESSTVSRCEVSLKRHVRANTVKGSSENSYPATDVFDGGSFERRQTSMPTIRLAEVMSAEVRRKSLIADARSLTISKRSATRTGRPCSRSM